MSNAASDTCAHAAAAASLVCWECAPASMVLYMSRKASCAGAMTRTPKSISRGSWNTAMAAPRAATLSVPPSLRDTQSLWADGPSVA